MKITKKRIIAVIVTTIFMLCLVACNKQKEDVSVWNSFDWQKVGEFTMEGNNETPLKEIGVDCNSISIRIDNYSSEKPVLLYVRLEHDETQKIVANKIALPATKEGKEVIITGPVQKGDHLRVFTQVFEETGEYNPNLECTLGYSYMLSR